MSNYRSSEHDETPKDYGETSPGGDSAVEHREPYGSNRQYRDADYEWALDEGFDPLRSAKQRVTVLLR